MGVALRQFNPKDADVRQLQQNVTDAVDALSNKPATSIGVLSISASRTLVGNEDVVLVDASTATGPLSLILPGVKLLTKRLTIHVVKGGPFAVTVKAVDIAQSSSPTINGAASVSIPSGQEGTIEIVSDGRVYWSW